MPTQTAEAAALNAELRQSVQFTLDRSGRVTAVVLSPTLWQLIIELLEDREDQALSQAFRELLAHHPATNGALRWKDVGQEWE